MIETDLHGPVKRFFEQQGYEVQAEVKNCDLVASARDSDELIVVELKLGVSLPLLIQATARQAITPHVYVAIPQKSYRRKQWLGIQRVVKQLGLGLLVVSISPLTAHVNEYFAPKEMRKTVKRKRSAVQHEVQQRLSSYNTAGSSRAQLMTAYKQNAIIIACFLEQLEEASAAHLKSLGTPANTRAILSDNHYGWFQRLRRGVYGLTEQVQAGHEQYPELFATGRELVASTLKDL
jgi:hypothetical protein